MEWSTPFVVYRLISGTLQEVFHPQELKKANYWMKYIALPWDVLCRTPIHPKHSTHQGSPEYVSHKSNNSQVTSVEKEWRGYLTSNNCNGALPQEQLTVPAGEANPSTPQ